MRVTIYYGLDDCHVLHLVDPQVHQERKSRSAVIVSLSEEHCERRKRLGEIRVDTGTIPRGDVQRGVERQQARLAQRLLEESLVRGHGVEESGVERASNVQGRFPHEEGRGP